MEPDSSFVALSFCRDPTSAPWLHRDGFLVFVIASYWVLLGFTGFFFYGETGVVPIGARRRVGADAQTPATGAN